nr:vegetative cell wall protein gp1-like [Aegilops tauschii subsp. strangulata]
MAPRPRRRSPPPGAASPTSSSPDYLSVSVNVVVLPTHRCLSPYAPAVRLRPLPSSLSPLPVSDVAVPTVPCPCALPWPRARPCVASLPQHQARAHPSSGPRPACRCHRHKPPLANPPPLAPLTPCACAARAWPPSRVCALLLLPRPASVSRRAGRAQLLRQSPPVSFPSLCAGLARCRRPRPASAPRRPLARCRPSTAPVAPLAATSERPHHAVSPAPASLAAAGANARATPHRGRLPGPPRRVPRPHPLNARSSGLMGHWQPGPTPLERLKKN